jgi:hypothetical protein
MVYLLLQDAKLCPGVILRNPTLPGTIMVYALNIAMALGAMSFGQVCADELALAWAGMYAGSVHRERHGGYAAPGYPLLGNMPRDVVTGILPRINSRPSKAAGSTFQPFNTATATVAAPTGPSIYEKGGSMFVSSHQYAAALDSLTDGVLSGILTGNEDGHVVLAGPGAVAAALKAEHRCAAV